MHYDLVIVGGGMVGASLAAALAQKTTLSIALIDAAPRQKPLDQRLIAINYNSYCFLQQVNIWPELANLAAPIEQVHISHRGHFGRVKISAQELALKTLGYVIPAKYINQAYENSLAKQASLTIFSATKLTALTFADHRSTLTLVKEDQISMHTATWVIGADGTFSTVRELLNIAIDYHDYHQSALVTSIDLTRSHHHVSYERFTADGAIAMLPLLNQQYACIWTAGTEKITALQQLSEKDFGDQLQQQFGYRLGALTSNQPRHVYPIKQVCAQELVKSQTLLLGNAAHTLHPIAAQGLNFALYEIAMLVQMICDAASTNTHLRDLDLKNYLAWQKTQLAQAKKFSHALPQVFSENYFGLSLARQMSFLGLDSCSFVKNRFARKVMARANTLPDLLLDPHHE